MYRLICILKSVILVSTNPLQGPQSCPLNYQQNYGQPEAAVTPTNYKPYQQQLVVQNQLTPSTQTIPYLYNDQIGRLYYQVQQNPQITTFPDANARVNDENGIEVKRYITTPVATTPIFKRYIIVPPQYLKYNQSIPNLIYFPCNNKVSKNAIDINNNDYQKKKKKTADLEKLEKRNGRKKKTQIENNEKLTVNNKSNDIVETKVESKENKQKKKKKRKSSKKNKKKREEQEIPMATDDKHVLKADEQKTNDSKLQTLKNENFDEFEERREKKITRKKSDDYLKTTKTPIEKIEKTESDQEGPEPQSNVELNDQSSLKVTDEVIKKTADVDVCFDINEDCANLDSRKTRNNCYETKYNNNNYNNNNYDKRNNNNNNNYNKRNNNNNNNNNYCRNCNQQHNMQRGCPTNIASYLNSLMSMSQLNNNFFNPFGNLPYNFNYLYQTPQQSSSKSNGSNKKRKKGKKKQKISNDKTKEETCSNKDQIQETAATTATAADCEKVVELTPVFMEIEETNEPLTYEIASPNPKKNEDETNIKTKEQEFENDKTVLEPTPEVITLPQHKVNYDHEEVFYVAPGGSQGNIPFLNENDLYDEYYPDFRSDHLYLSEEDYDFYNFHNRYYYASDNKAEMSREKRKYEKINEKKIKQLKDASNNERDFNYNKNKHSQRKDYFQEKPSEFTFRVPPPLEFPDFKTEMVNKDRDNTRKRSKNIEQYEDVGRKLDDAKVQDNEVETVCARSKVAKYGPSPNSQKISMFDLTPAKSEEKIIFSRDGDTTVVIAKSLGYPEDY